MWAVNDLICDFLTPVGWQAVHNSHFVFGVVEPGQSQDEIVRLDPWILFREMYRDRAEASRG